MKTVIVILGKKFFPLKTVEELGEGPGGPGHPLFFDQNEARITEKKIFWTPPPTTPPPPPYLKVWIRHCKTQN